VGNRMSMTVGTQTTNYSYNNANMLTNAGSESFQYDGNGNMIKKVNGSQTTNYTYDTENHLIQVGAQSLFGYDYSGRRISDTEPGPNGNPETKSFFWNGMDVVNEDSPYKQKTYNVLNGINLSESILDKNSNNPKNLYYQYDGLGSVANITDPGANLITAYRYDTYGKTLSGGQGVENDLQFVGSMGVRSQSSVGLIYMRNRWYDPALGVFIQKDPAKYKFNYSLYNYVLNNPGNELDPLGLWWEYQPVASYNVVNINPNSANYLQVFTQTTGILTHFDNATGQVTGSWSAVSGGGSGNAIPEGIYNNGSNGFNDEPTEASDEMDAFGNSYFYSINPSNPSIGVHPAPESTNYMYLPQDYSGSADRDSLFWYTQSASNPNQPIYVTQGCLGITEPYAEDVAQQLNSDSGPIFVNPIVPIDGVPPPTVSATQGQLMTNGSHVTLPNGTILGTCQNGKINWN
jgi:RHS repeat-associated protein